MAFQPNYSISNKTTNALTIIERSRGFLEAAKLSDVWLENMQNQALVKEAHHTTHIEGTELTLEQAEMLLAGQPVAQADLNDKKELLNYRDAFNLVASYIDNGGPITEVLIREIHKELVKGVRGNAATPGSYRKIPNYVVNSMTKEVIYTPPPANEVPILMAALVDWLNHRKDINAIIVSAIAQFQLVHIHPFLDGNGRSARLLSTLCLYKAGYDFKRLFSLSEFYDRDRQEYYHRIQSARDNDLDLTHWIEYYAEGLATQMTEVCQLGKRVIEIDLLVKDHPLNERQQSVVTYLAEHTQMGIRDYEQLCPSVNKRTLQRELKAMVDMGLLIVEGQTNRRIYKLKD